MKILIKNGRVIDPASQLRRGLRRGAGSRPRARRSRTSPPGFAPNKVIDATGCIVAPGLVDLAARLREPGHEHEGMLESEMAAAVAGGVTSLVCPPDTDPVLDEPGLVEMLKFRAEKLHQARVFPLGALTRNLQGEILTEMVELTEAGCVGFSQAEVPLANTQVLQRALQYAATYGYTDVAAAAGTAPGQGRGRQRPAGHAPGPVRRAGGGRDHRAAHHLRTDEDAPARACTCAASAARPGVALVRQAKDAGLAGHLRRQHQLAAPDRHRHRLLRQPHAPESAAAPAARPRRAARRPGRRHHRRAGVRPHAGGRGRQDAAVRRGRSRAPPGSNCCWGWRSSGARKAASGCRARWRCSPASPPACWARRWARLQASVGQLVEGGDRRRLRVRSAGAMDGRRRRAAQPGQAHAVLRLRAAGPRALHHRRRPDRLRRLGRADPRHDDLARRRGGWGGRWCMRLRGLVHHPVSFPAAEPAASARHGCKRGPSSMLAAAGRHARAARRAACRRAGAAGGQPHFLAGHPGDACRAVLPLRLQVRREALAADRHPGHRRRHALHRTRVAARRDARGAPHAPRACSAARSWPCFPRARPATAWRCCRSTPT